MPLNTRTQNIRTTVAVMAFTLVAGLSTQAFATLSSPVAEQKTLVADVTAPMADVRIDAKSEEPLIRVAPIGSCGSCRFFGG